jgi:SpoVK/Ycf46/Vps4 family AAA+-type ATPase
VNHIVVIGTTNYPEKLDKRLINRPGRFDRVVRIGLPGDGARALYLSAKMGTTQAPDGTDLVSATKGLSFGHLRELIVAVEIQGKPVRETLDRLNRMRKTPKSSEGDASIGFGGEE